MSISKYVINWEELLEVIGDKFEVNIDDIELGGLKSYLREQFDEIIDLMEQILYLLQDRGAQKTHSISYHIPAVIADYKLPTIFDKDVLITGITYSQSAWKYQDSWSLEVCGKTLFEEVGTKEIGESKQMNVFYFVPAGKSIDIVYHNSSGNSKLVWFDIEYIDLSAESSIPDPSSPPIDHDYDWMVVLRWEDNTDTDLDLHCYLDCDPDKHIYYSNKDYIIDEDNRVWLDYDYTSHGANGRAEEPEIITILGLADHTANIYITNYDAGTITEDVTMEVFKCKDGKDKKVETITLSPDEISGSKSIYVGNIKNDEFILKNQDIHYEKTYMDLSSCEI